MKSVKFQVVAALLGLTAVVAVQARADQWAPTNIKAMVAGLRKAVAPKRVPVVCQGVNDITSDLYADEDDARADLKKTVHILKAAGYLVLTSGVQTDLVDGYRFRITFIAPLKK